MLLDGGRLPMTCGTMGGRQPQTNAALVTRVVDFGYDAQQAIEATGWRSATDRGGAGGC